MSFAFPEEWEDLRRPIPSRSVDVAPWHFEVYPGVIFARIETRYLGKEIGSRRVLLTRVDSTLEALIAHVTPPDVPLAPGLLDTLQHLVDEYGYSGVHQALGRTRP